MDRIYGLFLQAVRAAMQARQVDWDSEVTPDDLTRLLELSREHHVLPLVFEAVYTCPAAKDLDPGRYAMYRSVCVHSIMTQALKTEEFLELYAQWRQAGLKPLVVKGLICRQLYPMPDSRFSGDEDVFSGPDQFKACQKIMLSAGLEPCGTGLDTYEIPFRREGSPLYIELHKALFPQDSDIFGDCNRFFDSAFERSVEVDVQGAVLYTLCPTDHMLYLIVHAYKHFLHSGFGIRQVCDVILYANRYGSRIDWTQLLENCRQIHADRFAAAMFRIGSHYFVFDADAAAYPEAWRSIEADELPMLEDLLRAGIYGSADMSRKHSSSITLDAVAARKQGKKAKNAVLASVFPPLSELQGRYPYLKKHPWLLPAAWCSRIWQYSREDHSGNNRAAESLKIGSERIELMRKYGIIE